MGPHPAASRNRNSAPGCDSLPIAPVGYVERILMERGWNGCALEKGSRSVSET